ncbi:MAG: 2-hydroxyacid dehydrogenase [Phycisphaerales bacterium]
MGSGPVSDSSSSGARVRVSRPIPGVFDVPGEVRFGPQGGFGSVEGLHEFVRGADAIVSWVSERVDGALLDAAGDGLKVVANFAVGYDNIDLEACRARGVVATNTPDAVTEGTADCAAMLLLAAARRVAGADRFVRSGGWGSHGILGPTEMLGQPIAGRELLIVGAGRIGYATALRMLGWGMRFRYVARTAKPAFEQAPLNAERVDLREGLRTADFVSVHVPLSASTRHLIGAEELSLMKSSAVLVNTARGAIIDESALCDALEAGRIWGAGLDVFEREPTPDPRLLSMENVVLTPHYGSASMASRERMTALCAANIRAVLGGEEAVTPIPGSA